MNDQDGVSNVIGAILLFSLLVMSMVMVQTQFVPVWDEDREARHMDEVTAQMAIFVADLDRLTANASRGSIANPVTLHHDAGFRFVQSAKQPGEIAFVPAAAGTGISLDSPRMTILQADGQTFYGLAEPADWVALDNVDDTIDDISALRALRIRVDLSDPSAYDHGDKAELTITDRNGAYAGKAVVTYLNIGGSERAVRTQIYSASGAEISSNLESFFHNTNLGWMYIDVMDRSLLFDAVFAAAQKPVTLAMVRTGLMADYVVVYDLGGGAGAGGGGGGGGGATVGTVGLTLSPYDPAPFASGRMEYKANNQRFVEQHYVVEHGAVLRVQDGVPVFVVAPRFHTAVGGTTTVLEWTLPSLTGGQMAIAGPHTASMVANAPVASTDLRGWLGQLSIDIPSAYPSAWAATLQRDLEAAGLSAASGHFSIATDVDSVTITVHGLESDPGTDDVFLIFKQAQIELELKGSG